MTEKLKWLEGYSGQTTNELIGLEEEYRVPSLVLAFEQAIARRSMQRRLTEAELAVVAVEALEREVNNGGYSQFFINTPHFAASIVPALIGIGCPQTAEITRKALDALEAPNLEAEKIRAAASASNGERDSVLERCDRLYFDSMEPIAAPLFEFIKSHRTAIKI